MESRRVEKKRNSSVEAVPTADDRQKMKEELKEIAKSDSIINKAIEELDRLSQDVETRAQYSSSMIAESDRASALLTAEQRGERKKRDVKTLISNVERIIEEMQRKAFLKGKLEGKRVGKQEGIREGKLEVARALLSDGMNYEKVKKLTGLTDEELKPSPAPLIAERGTLYFGKEDLYNKT